MRDIFHIRLKQFEVQAERILDASLRSRAVAIISSHHQTGTIVALSQEAREEGLYQGMKVSLARKMSHCARLLPFNNKLYTRINRYLYQTLSSFSPLVEPSAFGQFYLDMTGMNNLHPSQRQAGHSMTREIQFKVNLNSQVGISPNKLVSQISTEVVPDTISQVIQGHEARFLAPLATHLLPITRERSVQRIVDFLLLRQVQNLQELAEREAVGKVLFGTYFPQVRREAQGLDTSAVRPPRLRDHIIEQQVLAADTNDENILRAVVRRLAEQVAFQLRQRRQVTRALTLEIHYTDGFRNARKGSVSRNDDPSVTETCLGLFTRANYRRNRVRAIFLDATHLKMTAQQLNLFATPQTTDQHLSQALDNIRNQFGFGAIQTAA